MESNIAQTYIHKNYNHLVLKEDSCYKIFQIWEGVSIFFLFLPTCPSQINSEETPGEVVGGFGAFS